MKKEIVQIDEAAEPKAPYSQAVIYNGMLFTSGQGPVDPKTQQITKGSFESEARLVLNNLKTIVEKSGFSMSNVIKVTIFLADINRFSEFNEIYKEFFPAPPPARSCIQAGKLPFGIQCEVEAIVGK